MKHKKARSNPLSKKGKRVLLFSSLGLAASIGLLLALTPRKAKAAARGATTAITPTEAGNEGVESPVVSPSPTAASSTTTPLDDKTPAFAPSVEAGDKLVDGATLLDYPVDLSPGTITIAKPYPQADSPKLAVSFKLAPELGLSQNPEVIAREIALRLGKDKAAYQPTDAEVRMLAYMLAMERPNTGGRITELDAQRERAGMLWAVVNRIQKSGKSIKNTISSTDFVGYYKDFDSTSLMDQKLKEYPEFKGFVKAFFKGYLQEETRDLTSWVHAGYIYVKRWRAWSLPAGTRNQNGSIISGTSFAEPLYIGEAVFSRGIPF